MNEREREEDAQAHKERQKHKVSQTAPYARPTSQRVTPPSPHTLHNTPAFSARAASANASAFFLAASSSSAFCLAAACFLAFSAAAFFSASFCAFASAAALASVSAFASSAAFASAAAFAMPPPACHPVSPHTCATDNAADGRTHVHPLHFPLPSVFIHVQQTTPQTGAARLRACFILVLY